jgi:hypothetical protein
MNSKGSADNLFGDRVLVQVFLCVLASLRETYYSMFSERLTGTVFGAKHMRSLQA